MRHSCSPLPVSVDKSWHCVASIRARAYEEQDDEKQRLEVEQRRLFGEAINDYQANKCAFTIPFRLSVKQRLGCGERPVLAFQMLEVVVVVVDMSWPAFPLCQQNYMYSMLACHGGKSSRFGLLQAPHVFTTMLVA